MYNSNIFNLKTMDSMSHTSAAVLHESHKAGASSPAAPAPRKEVYNLLFILLLDAMTVRQQTVEFEAASLSLNASLQDQKNQEAGDLKMEQIPAGATVAQIDAIQNYNQGIAAARENIQDELITLRQKSQVLMTQTNTDVNALEQDASMDSGWLRTLYGIFQVINQMSPGH